MSRKRKESKRNVTVNDAVRRVSRWFFGLIMVAATMTASVADALSQRDVDRIDVNRVEEWTFERRDEFLERVEHSLTSLCIATEEFKRTARDEAEQRPLTGMETSLRAISRRVEAARAADAKGWSTAKLRLVEGLGDIYRQFNVVQRGTTSRKDSGR